MPLDEEQKEALKKKYKQHRREIWRGETSRSKKDKIENEDVFLEDSDQRLSGRPTTQKEYQDRKQHLRVSDESPKTPREDDMKTIRDIKPEKPIIAEPRNIDFSQRRRSSIFDDADAPTEIIELEEDTTIIDNQPVKKEINDDETIVLDNEQDEEKGGITWKLALFVIMGIIGAFGIGVLLGYFMAPYL